MSKASITSLLVSIALERLSIVENVHSETVKIYSRAGAASSEAAGSQEVEELLRLNDRVDVIMKALINKEIYIEGIMDMIHKIHDNSGDKMK